MVRRPSGVSAPADAAFRFSGIQILTRVVRGLRGECSYQHLITEWADSGLRLLYQRAKMPCVPRGRNAVMRQVRARRPRCYGLHAGPTSSPTCRRPCDELGERLVAGGQPIAFRVVIFEVSSSSHFSTELRFKWAQSPVATSSTNRTQDFPFDTALG